MTADLEHKKALQDLYELMEIEDGDWRFDFDAVTNAIAASDFCAQVRLVSAETAPQGSSSVGPGAPVDHTEAKAIVCSAPGSQPAGSQPDSSQPQQ